MLSLPFFVGRFFIVLSFEMLPLQTIFRIFPFLSVGFLLFRLRNASPTDNFQNFCIFVGRFFIIGSFEMLHLQTISRISAFLSVGSPLRRK